VATEEQKDDREPAGKAGEPAAAEKALTSPVSEPEASSAPADSLPHPVADAPKADAAGGDDRGEDEGDEDGDDEAGETAEAKDEKAEAKPSATDEDEEDEDEAKPAAKQAPSAGARLAAAKAAKAAKKAAKRGKAQAASGLPAGMLGGGRGREPVEALKETSIGQAATKAGEWAQSNRPVAYGIAAAIVLAMVGAIGWTVWSSGQTEAAGAALAEAVRIANAEVDPDRHEPAGDPDDSSDEEPSDEADEDPWFPSRQARAEAALEAYQGVLRDHGGSDAARWARLGEGRALFDLGRHEEARRSYELALREAGGDPMVAWRALEGIGFTYEVEDQWEQAIEQYEELRTVEDGRYEAVADYHIARMRIAMGDRAAATTALRGLVERLRADSESEEPDFPYVLAQAEVRLRELDPGASATGSSPMMIGPQGDPGAGVPGLEGLPPEILEQLRRQLEQSQGAEGAEGGSEGGGE
jgi:tetratricopeptide (TPR) repeat protein